MRWYEKVFVFVLGASYTCVLTLLAYVALGVYPKDETVYSAWEPKQMLCRTASGIGGYGPQETCIEIKVRPR